MTDEHQFPPEPVARRRVPAGQALTVVVVALLVGALLNADRLHHTASTQPFGWQRTWAMRLTGPLQDVSHLTRLNVPRKVLSETAGTEDGPPPEDTRTVVTAPPLVGPDAPADGERAAASTTTTTAPPPEVRIPTEEEPLRIMVAGDSLVMPLGPSLVERFDGQPVEVVEAWKAATGLARPDVLSWPAKLEEDLAREQPDVVVLGFGGNDAQDMTGPEGRLPRSTPEWAAEYQRRVAQVLEVVEAEGRTVYWVGLPQTTASNIEEAAPLMQRAEEAEIAARPWAHFVDTRPILSPDGTYSAYLPDGSGGQVKVRQDDGVHLTNAGAARVVTPLAELIAEERELE